VGGGRLGGDNKQILEGNGIHEGEVACFLGGGGGGGGGGE